MGQIGRQLAGYTAASGLEESGAEFAEAAQQLPDIRELVGAGHDPLHAVYIQAQNLTSVFAEAVSELEELHEYAEIVGDAEEDYMPEGPPISPLTRSYFTTWAFFDVPFGRERETVGTCLLDLADRLGMEEWLAGVVRNYQGSRMGIYEHRGRSGSRVRLRELITGRELTCHPTSGYRGRKGQLWYVRLCPPVAELTDYADYHIVVTTPYVLQNAGRDDWTAYLKKNLAPGRPAEEALHEFLKYGPERYHWHDFVLQAYTRHQYDAIFLSGLPDVKGSLPHAE